MARLLEEIGWLDPVVSLPDDPAWAAEIKRVMGMDVPAYRYTARSPWIRAAQLHLSQVRTHHASDKLTWLTILVTSQENSCRFCYGGARAMLTMLGLDKAQLDRVERDVRMSGADEGERAILQFCRNLSRSSPRPARAEFEALVAAGQDPKAMIEVACNVGMACFSNRISTFIAVPLDAHPKMSAWDKVKMMLAGSKYPLRLSPPADQPPGPFSAIVGLIQGTEGSWVIDEALRGAFASKVLPTRTKAWVFAVVARALGCHVCDRASGQLLEREGVTADVRERLLGSLAGPELDATEAVLLPWVRETVHYQTEVMQRKTRELKDRLGEEVTLEAIGLAALANACSRLSMLAQ